MFWTGFFMGLVVGSVLGVAGLALLAINADGRR
jgi:hypothetical protein